MSGGSWELLSVRINKLIGRRDNFIAYVILAIRYPLSARHQIPAIIRNVTTGYGGKDANLVLVKPYGMNRTSKILAVPKPQQNVSQWRKKPHWTF